MVSISLSTAIRSEISNEVYCAKEIEKVRGDSVVGRGFALYCRKYTGGYSCNHSLPWNNHAYSRVFAVSLVIPVIL